MAAMTCSTKQQMAADIDFAYKTMGKVYVCDTPTVKRWNKVAAEKGYNRALSDECLLALDENGNHLINCVIAHHTNYEGKQSVRCSVWLKMNGTDKPTDCILDIPHDKWREFVTNKVSVTRDIGIIQYLL
jgi:hypothetical protein